MSFKKIIVPTDFSEDSLKALDYAIDIAQKFGSEIKVLYVIEPLLQAADMSWTSVDFEEIEREHEESASKQLEGIIADNVPSGTALEAVIRSGKPFVEIVRYAKELQADLIVMATHGRGAVAHILMGSTAEKVVRKAPCPVLTIKHPKQMFSMP